MKKVIRNLTFQETLRLITDDFDQHPLAPPAVELAVVDEDRRGNVHGVYEANLSLLYI